MKPDLVRQLARDTPGDVIEYCRRILKQEAEVIECFRERRWDESTINEFMEDARNRVREADAQS